MPLRFRTGSLALPGSLSGRAVPFSLGDGTGANNLILTYGFDDISEKKSPKKLLFFVVYKSGNFSKIIVLNILFLLSITY